MCAELPSQLVSKRLGPDVWLPIQLYAISYRNLCAHAEPRAYRVAWSIIAMSQCKITGRGSFFATRCLLGLLEGGFIPGSYLSSFSVASALCSNKTYTTDMVLFLSYFYKGKELPVRLSFFWVSLTLTNISGALLGYGILRMRCIFQ